MGLFKGSVASIVSGKIGGLVFQKNGRIRPYRMPSNPRTTLQDNVRAAFITAASLWTSIDESARDAWTTYASLHPKMNRLGDSIVITGKQCLIGFNVPRLQVGLTAIVVAPAEDQLNVTPVGAGPEGTISGDGNAMSIDGLLLSATMSMAVYVGKPRAGSSVRGRKELVYAGSIAGASTPVTTGSVMLPSGTAAVGDIYDVKYITRNTLSLVYSVQYDTVTVLNT